MMNGDTVTVKQLTLAAAAIMALFGSTIAYLEVQEAKRNELRAAAHAEVVKRMETSRLEIDELTAFAIGRMDEQRDACRAELDWRDQRLFKALGFEDVPRERLK